MKKILSTFTLCCFASLISAPLTSYAQTANQPRKKTVGYDPSVPEATQSNIRYGDKKRNVLDFWKAASNKPTPLVLVIHGGGWNGGSKELLHKSVDTDALLKAGISVAAINYRLIKHAGDLQPKVKAPMQDVTRAVQFIRSRAAEWNIDKTRIAATGVSAGACSSLWIAYHDDLADPNSTDPVARESTRLMCVAASRGQTTLDPEQMKEWIHNSKYGAHAFGKDSFDQFLAERDSLLDWINEYSPYALLTADDPPTYLYYEIRPASNKVERNPTHSAIFGIKLHERCIELGVASQVVYPGASDVKHESPTSYLIATLLSK